MHGQQQAILRIVPGTHAAGVAGELNAARRVAIAAGSSAAVMIPKALLTEGCWVTLKPSIECQIAFGNDTLLAATANDLTFFAGVTEDYWVPPGYDRFFVFGAGAGTLSWHRSNR